MKTTEIERQLEQKSRNEINKVVLEMMKPFDDFTRRRKGSMYSVILNVGKDQIRFSSTTSFRNAIMDMLKEKYLDELTQDKTRELLLKMEKL